MSSNLRPVEIIRIGIEAGQSADVILASLEAQGWVVAPTPPTREMVEAAWLEGHPGADEKNGVLVREYSVSPDPDNLASDTAYEVYQAMLAARPKG